MEQLSNHVIGGVFFSYVRFELSKLCDPILGGAELASACKCNIEWVHIFYRLVGSYKK